MATFEDKEFGTVTVRRFSKSRNVKLSVAPNGTLRVSMPPLAPLFLAKRLIASSRSSVRSLLRPNIQTMFHHGMSIGKSHSIHICEGSKIRAGLHKQIIDVTVTNLAEIETPRVQSIIKTAVLKALRKEAKSYLPKRLAFLAQKHSFNYSSVRFSHASSRWGSCSSQGTISLNIALMTLPFELIDYVLLHELAHTKEMNHSQHFWETVEQISPDYRSLRAQLKNHSPTI